MFIRGETENENSYESTKMFKAIKNLNSKSKRQQNQNVLDIENNFITDPNFNKIHFMMRVKILYFH